jgi:hypothetical protein
MQIVLTLAHAARIWSQGEWRAATPSSAEPEEEIRMKKKGKKDEKKGPKKGK